ncbi:hypothetical protein HMPREF3156_01831 [Neisseria sp. HMSC06F02]|nr:hypothetical protein HMPREF3156_01831 [Neisseria sp. HMSC06F02]
MLPCWFDLPSYRFEGRLKSFEGLQTVFFGEYSGLTLNQYGVASP